MRRSVTVVVTDEYGAHAERELVIVIRGANEAPEITYGKSSLVLEESGVVGAGMEKVDGVMNDGGSFTVFDKDANDAHELSVTIEGLVQGRDYTVSTDPDSGVTTVATGGNAPRILRYCKRPIQYDADLIMTGLYLLYQKNAKKYRKA